MSDHISGPADSALLEAFSARGYRMLIQNRTTAQVITPGGPLRFDISAWMDQAAALSPAELPGFAAQYVQWAAQYLEPASAAPDLGAPNLRVQVFPEAEVGAVRDRLVTRDLAPGLVQMAMFEEADGFAGVGRGQVDAADQDIFAAALSHSIAAPHSVGRYETSYGTLLYVETRQPFASAHAAVLTRYVAPGEHPHGAVVSIPAADYLLIYPLGQAHPLETLFDMNNATEQIGEKAVRRISSQLYWWRPGRYEHLAERDALHSGQGPELVPIGLTMGEKDPRTNTVDVRLTTPATGELFQLFGG